MVDRNQYENSTEAKGWAISDGTTSMTAFTVETCRVIIEIGNPYTALCPHRL